MTMPDTENHGLSNLIASQVNQVLVKQTDMVGQLAGISEQLRGMQDIPARVRQLELDQAQNKGGRDMWARLFAILAVLAAIGSVVVMIIYRRG